MKKVLVAEDEESIREFIVINLTRSGYNVEQAENGAVALEKFSQDENSLKGVMFFLHYKRLLKFLWLKNYIYLHYF